MAETEKLDREAASRRALEWVARHAYGRLLAYLASRTHDLEAAEDALSDALTSALEEWTANGLPDRPEAWLITVARRKAVDAYRRGTVAQAAGDELRALAERFSTLAPVEPIPDRRLALLFACVHPAIAESTRAPLMLQVIFGLDAKRIGAAFLVAPATMGKRLVRAKAKIRAAGIPLRIPERHELQTRAGAVLDAVYAAYGDGWADPAACDPTRRALGEEAVFLARLVAELLPDEPEASGLLSLLLHCEARRGARRSQNGEFVPLSEQDLGAWDWPMIAEAEERLRRASVLATPGRYQLQAALQSAHVERRRTGRSNWPGVVALYDLLLALEPNPVVAVNRAVAIAQARSPAEGLAALHELEEDPRLSAYQAYWAARSELLATAGRRDEACKAAERAIELERDPAVRRHLQGKLRQLRSAANAD